ncbi:site-2 protease family protein [Pseudalkalibacillus sp. Hm43]|uniref:site-2 protease family protein n=1 Tax=Pseudalkalibacillus sp. Hm43 TaxID=3450742 RepID=UPI003F41DD16
MIPIIVILILFPISTFLHEMGHYITARMTGIKASEIRMGLGPVIMKIHRPSLHIEVGLFFFLGAYTISRGSDQTGDFQRLLISLNGPLVNLVLALYAYLILNTLQGDLSEALVSLFAFINIWIAIGNLIPFQIKGKKSDGWIVFESLWKVIKRKTAH